MGVVMAGGRATRFRTPVEKAVLEVDGRTLLERSVDALRCRQIEGIIIATSERHVLTRRLASEMDIDVMITSGTGYHEDTMQLIAHLGRFVSLNVDVPFVRPEHVERLIGSESSGSIATVVSIDQVSWRTDPESIMTTSDGRRMAWIGLNIVSSDKETAVEELDDPLLAFNINTEEELAAANILAKEKNL